MNETELLKSLGGLGSVAVIVGLVQVLKPLLPSAKIYGLLAVVMGIVINLGIAWAITGLTALSLVASGLNGIIAGLAASGAYSTNQTRQGKVVVPEEEIESLKKSCSEIPNTGTEIPK